MNIKKILRIILLLFCYFIIGLFLVITIAYLFFDHSLIGIIVSFIYPPLAPFLIFIVIAAGLIIIRCSFWNNKKYSLVIGVICIFLLVVALMPHFSIPSKVSDAENQFIQIYGSAYTNLDTTEMRPVAFSIYDSINGIVIDESKFSFQRDIRYLNNGNDSFYFDWYKPNGVGPFPTIIIIHGGGFVLGDKGDGREVSKYLASKGYVVFDLQYGIYNLSALLHTELGSTFEFMAGLVSSAVYNQSYTLEEQINNIGNFTKVLELNSTKYHADLNDVFILGRSAGGCIASVITNGYKNPLFSGTFAPSMNISGGIWFYPVTDLRISLGNDFLDPILQGSLPLAEQYKKYSSTFLLTNSSIIAPSLILHGDKDGLVDYQTQSKDYYTAAKQENETCLLVTIPMHGHAFDMIFQSYGSQMGLYFIERFLALEKGA